MDIKIVPSRPMGGTYCAWDIGNTTLYGHYDLNNGLFHLRQAYTNHEISLSAPTRTQIEGALQQMAGQILTK